MTLTTEADTPPRAGIHSGVELGPETGTSTFQQPKAVWAVAFACVISFMGIGLVDPILPALTDSLGATPSQVELLFTSYLVVTAVMMLITGWVSSRIGAKRTLLVGLAIIVVFAAAAGASGGIVGFRAGWGVGNALFIATSLAVIVGSASGGFAGAIVLYETALGIGIASGPILGGELGSISWRGPFFGVSVLMLISLVATAVLLPPTPKPARKEKISEPIRALRHRTLATTSVVGLLYNWAFFTVLGYSPFLMAPITPQQLGLVFCGWGVFVAIFAIWGAPWFRGHLGTAKTSRPTGTRCGRRRSTVCSGATTVVSSRPSNSRSSITAGHVTPRRVRFTRMCPRAAYASTWAAPSSPRS